jgi:hypothetical protein
LSRIEERKAFSCAYPEEPSHPRLRLLRISSFLREKSLPKGRAVL